MKTRPLIAALALLLPTWAGAQNMSQEPQEDPVQKAIREFNEKRSGKPNEVTIDAREEIPTTPSNADPKAADPPMVSEEKPILVTGTPPEGSELVKDTPVPGGASDNPAGESTITDNPSAPQKEQTKGLAVRVEKLQSGAGTVDPTKIKLLAPFPAKPIAPPPAGWHLEDSENAPPFNREVELSPGKKITLKVKPQVLVPDSDGVHAFTVMEPGYDPSLGYCQNATVSAVLARSIRQLDEDSKQLGAVVDNLQQLLVSLPKPEPRAEPVPEPAKNPNPQKK